MELAAAGPIVGLAAYAVAVGRVHVAAARQRATSAATAPTKRPAAAVADPRGRAAGPGTARLRQAARGKLPAAGQLATERLDRALHLVEANRLGPQGVAQHLALLPAGRPQALLLDTALARGLADTGVGLAYFKASLLARQLPQLDERGSEPAPVAAAEEREEDEDEEEAGSGTISPKSDARSASAPPLQLWCSESAANTERLLPSAALASWVDQWLKEVAVRVQAA